MRKINGKKLRRWGNRAFGVGGDKPSALEETSLRRWRLEAKDESDWPAAN
jgi:hypothetical protein